MKKGIVKELIIIGVIVVVVGGVVLALTNKSDLDSSSKSNEITGEINPGTSDNSSNTQNNPSNTGNKEDVKEINFDLTNSTQSIFEGEVNVSLVKVEYKNNTLTIDGQVDNNSNESIVGHVSNFYFKDSNEVITNLDFFDNPSFNINAPSGGKTNFQMIFNNLKLEGNNFTIGGEFFKFGYFGSDKKINLEVRL
ncbi:hypothetical protein [Clostridium nigeriense]|uniref:hypothetical protein n=1 Tax=Clostridium nigeriense TaxID=1805470 RepID=UPI00082F7C03|nr:hypothetical protein [Clostridium nigeriense]